MRVFFAFCLLAPKCGFIKSNEKIIVLLDRLKPEIVFLRETIITVSFYEPGTFWHLHNTTQSETARGNQYSNH